MTVTATEQILAGNLGEGWADETVVAYVFAEYLKTRLEADARDYFPTADEIIVKIDVQENASGYGGELSVDVDPWEWDSDIINPIEAEKALAYTFSAAWDHFCASEEAKRYAV
jgi:hypothetical protein